MRSGFLDTNVIIYAAQARPDQRNKRELARALIETTEFGLSAQVLAEFYAVVTKKGTPPMTPAAALGWIERLAEQPCVNVDANLVIVGAEISARYQISYWDAAIVAAAERLGTDTLYTEDLNHGQKYGSVEVCNPFLGLRQ